MARVRGAGGCAQAGREGAAGAGGGGAGGAPLPGFMLVVPPPPGARADEVSHGPAGGPGEEGRREPQGGGCHLLGFAPGRERRLPN